MSEWKFDAIGTKWALTTSSKISAEIKQLVQGRIEDFDKNYSRFRTDSLVSKMSKTSGEYDLPNDAEPLFDLYKKLYDLTNGLVTPLIGHTLEQAGYDAQYSFQSTTLTSPTSWNESLNYNFPKLTIKQPVLLDFGAAGKGYLVDLVAEILIKNNIDNFCINAGGDIFIYGKPQTVLLENPDDTTTALGQIKIQNSALCGSGINRRNWGSYHHVIDPKKLKSPTNIKAVWVQAANTLLADGLATALMFVSPAILREHFEFEYAMIVDEGIRLSQKFDAEFFNE